MLMEKPDCRASGQKQWFVLQSYTRREKEAVHLLKERIVLADMQEMFGEILMPTERIFEMKKDRKKHSERLFFPGYILIQMALDSETWNLVKGTRYIIGFVGGTKEKPVALPDEEVESILKTMETGEQKERPKIVFDPGEKIRVVDGPFKDFSGMVEDVNYDRNSLKVAVSILGRSTPVELGFDQVEKT